MKHLFVFLLLLGISSCSTPKGQTPEAIQEPTPKLKASCKMGDDLRLIEVKEGQKSKCETHYQKDNKNQIAAEAIWDTSYCLKVYNLIKAKLEDAGYSCSEI